MTLLSTLQSATLSLWHPQGNHHAHPSILSRALSRLMLAHTVWQQRQMLLGLDASMLDDIGLNRAEATAEAAKPIWDVPQTWRN